MFAHASDGIEAALAAASVATGSDAVVPIAVGVLSDGERQIGARGCEPDARFRIASLTKPMVAQVALGVGVDLDAPLDGFAFSLRDCLTHTCGLDTDVATDLAAYADVSALAADRDAFLPLAAPGVWGYCNAGYWLAGAELVRTAGATGATGAAAGFEALLRTHVFEPFGMRDSTTAATDVPVETLAGAAATTPYPVARIPSGGVLSTAADLLAFAAGVLDGDGGLLAAARAPTVAAAETTRWGLGWCLSRFGAHEVVEHPGRTPGYATHLALLPERRQAIVVLIAASEPDACVAALDAGLAALTGATREPAPAVALDDSHRALTGTYARRSLTIDVSVDDAAAHVSETGDEGTAAHVARPVGPGTLEVVDGPLAGSRLEALAPGLVRWDRRLLRAPG